MSRSNSTLGSPVGFNPGCLSGRVGAVGLSSCVSVLRVPLGSRAGTGGRSSPSVSPPRGLWGGGARSARACPRWECWVQRAGWGKRRDAPPRRPTPRQRPHLLCSARRSRPRIPRRLAPAELRPRQRQGPVLPGQRRRQAAPRHRHVKAGTRSLGAGSRSLSHGAR